MTEEWKDIVGWENIYQISNLGRIRCIRISYFEGDKDGDYIRVTLTDKERVERFPLHRLVAEAFCSGKTNEKKIVNHIDGNKRNNDSSNLEWVTYSENTKHALKIGKLIPKRGEELNKKLTEEKVKEILKLIDKGFSNVEIGRQFGVEHSMISMIRNNKSWKHIERKLNE